MLYFKEELFAMFYKKKKNLKILRSLGKKAVLNYSVFCRVWQGYILMFDMFITKILSFLSLLWIKGDEFIRDG